jgi:hypothetical protein
MIVCVWVFFNTFKYVEVGWWCFMWFKIWVWKYGLKYVLMSLKYDEKEIWFMWFWWENYFMRCLWFMKEVCVESMHMKAKVRWFYSIRHEHEYEWESA